MAIQPSIDINHLEELDYCDFNQMMCVRGGAFNQLNISFTTGTANLKTFLAMKKDVNGWFSKLSKEDQERITNYIKCHSN